MTFANVDLVHFQGFADDDVPGSATQKAIEDSGWTQDTGANFRIRFGLEETNNKADPDWLVYFEYSINAGSDWNDITGASSVIRTALSSHYADEDADNTGRLTCGGSSGFTGGVLDEDGVAGENAQIDFIGNDCWEIETCLTIVGADVTDEQEIIIRPKGLDAYTNPGPTITVNKVASVYYQSVSGAVTFDGSVTKKMSIPDLAGSLSFIGDITKKTSLSVLEGAISFAGAIARKTKKSIAGALQPAGTLTKKMSAALTGAISFAGEISRKTSKSLSGSLSFIGEVTSRSITVFKQSVSGAITFTGDLSKKTSKSLSGSLQPAGAVIKKMAAALQGTISTTGALSKKTKKALAGSASIAGALAKKTIKSFAGAISFAGSLLADKGGTIYKQSLAGAIALSGELSKKTNKALTGILQPAGAVTKKISKTFAGTLAVSGSLVKKIFKTLEGALTLLGVLSSEKLGGVTIYMDATVEANFTPGHIAMINKNPDYTMSANPTPADIVEIVST